MVHDRDEPGHEKKFTADLNGAGGTFKQLLFTQILVLGAIGMFSLALSPIPNFNRHPKDLCDAATRSEAAIEVGGQHPCFTAQEFQSLHVMTNQDPLVSDAGLPATDRSVMTAEPLL